MNKIPLIENACKELLSYGVWDGRSRCKYVVKRYLLRRETAKEDLIFWPTGLLAAGLWSCRRELIKNGGSGTEGQPLLDMIENALAAYYGRWLKKDMPVAVIDDLLAGETLLNIYLEMSKHSSANLLGLSQEKVREALDRLAAYAGGQPTDAAGSFRYRPAHGSMFVFVDGIGLACPFLYRYGETFGDQKYKELALVQIVNFLSYGMDGEGLPYHGYDLTDDCKYGIIGWGRAVGWLLRGMAGCLESNDGRKGLWEPFTELTDAVLAYQRQGGSFSWQLEALEGPVDTSATGMICASLKQGISQGVLTDEKYEKALWRGLDGLKGFVREGQVYNCSGECEGFSCYPQRYGAYPWSLGPALEIL